jgi:hypothetical protein
MKKPKLVIVSRNGILKGTCSSCPESVFSFEMEHYDQGIYEDAFNMHFRKVHMCEDASQAAARIVREATERD